MTSFLPPFDENQCRARVTLPKADVDHFDRIPQAAFMMEPTLQCDLMTRHEGVHSALLQGVGFDLYWVSWPEYLVEQAPRCPAVLDPGEQDPPPKEPEICLLRDGHPGEHCGGDHWFD
ncbi:hypothetical protein ACFVVX_24710 [Kitasatospora sp. NPDC058170]|uniref:hypothetical protein n=1 Tax=Kitasatospora sp. NPDC058170 TaxID=3346364 RepID=UPI0036D85D08